MSEKKLSRKNFEEVLLDITFFKKNNSNYHIVNTNNEMVHRDSKKGFNYCLQTEIGISSNNLFQYFVVLLNVKRKIFCENDLKECCGKCRILDINTLESSLKHFSVFHNFLILFVLSFSSVVLNQFCHFILVVRL